MTGRVTRGAEASNWIDTDRDRSVVGQEHLLAASEFTFLNPAINNSVPDGIWPGRSMPACIAYTINQLLLGSVWVQETVWPQGAKISHLIIDYCSHYGACAQLKGSGVGLFFFF